MYNLLKLTSYDPNKLIDFIITELSLKSDSELCRLLEVNRPIISNIRKKRVAVGATMLLRMHELSGIQVKKLREIMGDFRESFFSEPKGRS